MIYFVFFILLLLSLSLSSFADETILATDKTHVTLLGRPYLPTNGGVGLSWLGSGIRVSHTGYALRATFAISKTSFKVTFTQSNAGVQHFQGNSWIAATGSQETITIGSGSGMIDMVLNMPPQYFESSTGNASLLTLTSLGGIFNSAPSSPSRIFHILGDSITASTNIHGGTLSCADEGYEADYSASWGGILCLFFDASCSTVAVGGKCLLDECGGTQMQQYYQKERMIDTGNTFNFVADQAHPPVAFLSYLGTNDARMNLWPTFTQEYLKLFKNVTVDYYPKANVTFFLILGPMAPITPAEAHVAAVEQGIAAGYRVVLVNATTACTPNLQGCFDGCATHPGVGSHRSIARITAPIIATTMWWEMPGTL